MSRSKVVSRPNHRPFTRQARLKEGPNRTILDLQVRVESGIAPDSTLPDHELAPMMRGPANHGR